MNFLDKYKTAVRKKSLTVLFIQPTLIVILRDCAKSMFAVFLLVVIAGCYSSVSRPQTTSGVVFAWANLGMNLPSPRDVVIVRKELPKSLTDLRFALANTNQNVRVSSAYVAGELGFQAISLIPTLTERLQIDSEPIVRVYIALAIADIGQVDSNAISKLEECFQSEGNDDAKTAIAGALVRLRSPEEEKGAWQWLLNSLRAFPPNPPAEFKAQYAFWECRWTAVKQVRAVQGEDEVVLQLLKRLKANPLTPQWLIDQQVTSAIKEIKSRTR